MPQFATSNLGLLCLPMSHKKDARLIWVKLNLILPIIFCPKNIAFMSAAFNQIHFNLFSIMKANTMRVMIRLLFSSSLI